MSDVLDLECLSFVLLMLGDVLVGGYRHVVLPDNLIFKALEVSLHIIPGGYCLVSTRVVLVASIVNLRHLSVVSCTRV